MLELSWHFFSVCADDATARPSCSRPEAEGIPPRSSLRASPADRPRYLQGFHIGFDHWYSTDSARERGAVPGHLPAAESRGLVSVKAVEQFSTIR